MSPNMYVIIPCGKLNSHSMHRAPQSQPLAGQLTCAWYSRSHSHSPHNACIRLVIIIGVLGLSFSDSIV